MTTTTMKNRQDVLMYLGSIPHGGVTNARKWQAVRTATRRLMKAHGIEDAAKWEVSALPHQATARTGDCWGEIRRIRYYRKYVETMWIEELADLIVHEVAHAIVWRELRRQGRVSRHMRYGAKTHGGHGPMWRGTLAALGGRE